MRLHSQFLHISCRELCAGASNIDRIRHVRLLVRLLLGLSVETLQKAVLYIAQYTGVVCSISTLFCTYVILHMVYHVKGRRSLTFTSVAPADHCALHALPGNQFDVTSLR